jgi:hypothetical protein
MSADGERVALNVMERPNVLCHSVDLALAASDAPAQWKKYALAPERHDLLVALVDDPARVERYRIDARPPGSGRECIQDTSICYDAGISLSPGPLSSLGDAAYVLYIPPESDATWTEETTHMAEEYAAVSNECVSLGVSIEILGDYSGVLQAAK